MSLVVKLSNKAEVGLMFHRVTALMRLFGATLCLLLWAHIGYSDDAFLVSPSELAPRQIPRIVVPSVSPWGFVDLENRPKGLLLDFQQELFKRAGVTFDAELRPYPRVVHDLANGGADLGVMFVSPLAEQSGVSLGHVVTMRVILVAPVDRQKPIKSLDDLVGQRVGFIRGSKYGRPFDEHPDFEHIPVTNIEQALRMLVTDRLDAIVATEHALLYAMYITGIPASEFTAYLNLGAAQADLYLSRHSLRQPWVEPVRAALNSMNTDGTSLALFFGHNLWPRQEVCFSGGRCLTAKEPPASKR